LNTEEKINVRGPGRTSKADWINIAMQTLVEEGIVRVPAFIGISKIDQSFLIVY